MSDAGAAIRTPADAAAAARRIFTTGPALLRRLQHYRPYICPFSSLIELVPEGSRVLDVGCGGGLFLHLLNVSGRLHSGVGFDVSAPAIELANAARSDGSATLMFRRLDVEAPWPEGDFDVVSLVDVLHHVPPAAQRGVLRLAASRIRPGGRLIYKDMTSRGVIRPMMNRLHDLVLARQWIHYAPIDAVDRWMEEDGLGVSHRARVNTLWYGHEWLVGQRH